MQWCNSRILFGNFIDWQFNYFNTQRIMIGYIVQVRELVEAMHEKTVAKGCYVIREGE